MERRFDAIERRLSQQTGQMEGMKEELKNLREAFDWIMADYFQRITAMVTEITSFSGGEVESEEFKARIEALREAIGMLGSDTAALASPEMRKMYEEEIPTLRRSVSQVYDLIKCPHLLRQYFFPTSYSHLKPLYPVIDDRHSSADHTSELNGAD